MTRDEIKKLIAAMCTAFPSFELPKDAKDIGLMINTWHMVLEDEDYFQIQQAFKSFCRTNTSGFAPTPGQLIALIQDHRDPISSSAEEAWKKVLLAARDANYHAVERFEEFDDITKMCVGSAASLSTYGMIEDSELQTVIRSQFIKEYKRLEDMFRTERKYPHEVQNRINEERARRRQALGLSPLTDSTTNQSLIEGA